MIPVDTPTTRPRCDAHGEVEEVDISYDEDAYAEVLAAQEYGARWER